MTSAGRAYWAAEHEMWEEIATIVDRSTEIQEAMAVADAEPLSRRFLCPRRHLLRTLELHIHHLDGRDYPVLVPVEEAERPAIVASDATPRSTPRRYVCEEPGCPRLSEQTRCDKHGGGRDDTSAFRISLACSRCKYRGTHKQAGLLKLFALGVRLGVKDIRMTS